MSCRRCASAASTRTSGQQYIRGIEEGNGDPPGDYLWNTYSMNKEDLWVTRTQLPIRGTVDEHVNEDFEAANSPSQPGPMEPARAAVGAGRHRA